jgi:hypothetical protein
MLRFLRSIPSSNDDKSKSASGSQTADFRDWDGGGQPMNSARRLAEAKVQGNRSVRLAASGRSGPPAEPLVSWAAGRNKPVPDS